VATTKPAVWPFVALCGYLLSQIYLIPLYPWGPSWAVWPRLADLAVGFLVATALLSKPGNWPVTESSRAVFRLLVIGYIACIGSFFLVNLLVGAGGRGLAINDGQYYLYRATQFLVVYWVAMRTPLTPSRQRILWRIAAATLVVSCLLCYASWFGALPGPALVRHLPQAREVCGPWAVYVKDRARGYGLIGFNHGYVAAQLLILTALTLNLAPRRRPLVDVTLIALALGACFACGSRAGFAAMGLFTFALFVRNPIYVPLAALLLGVASMFVPEQFASGDIERVATEQAKIANPMEAAQFRARLNIWSEWLDRFYSEPHLLVMGLGFGGVRGEAGERMGHMQYLTVLGEFGIIGLLFFLWLYYTILHGLWRHEAKPSPVFWATVALLFGALTQETFYPVVSFGHFLGLYFFTVALALRPQPVAAVAGPAAGSRERPSAAIQSDPRRGRRETQGPVPGQTRQPAPPTLSTRVRPQAPGPGA
jgi:hypothetical protein